MAAAPRSAKKLWLQATMLPNPIKAYINNQTKGQGANHSRLALLLYVLVCIQTY